MRLLRGTPHVPGPAAVEPTEDPAPDRCIACRRSGVPLVDARLEDGTPEKLCPDPGSCRHHWPREAA